MPKCGFHDRAFEAADAFRREVLKRATATVGEMATGRCGPLRTRFENTRNPPGPSVAALAFEHDPQPVSRGGKWNVEWGRQVGDAVALGAEPVDCDLFNPARPDSGNFMFLLRQVNNCSD